MTPELQRIAIAEVCPPTVVIFRPNCGSPVWRDKWEYEESSGSRSRVEFDPLEDLNAMHEAEKVLTATQRQTYIAHLIDIVHADVATNRGIVFATAAQRAEAFLRTLNLWKDGQGEGT